MPPEPMWLVTSYVPSFVPGLIIFVFQEASICHSLRHFVTLPLRHFIIPPAPINVRISQVPSRVPELRLMIGPDYTAKTPAKMRPVILRAGLRPEESLWVF